MTSRVELIAALGPWIGNPSSALFAIVKVVVKSPLAVCLVSRRLGPIIRAFIFFIVDQIQFSVKDREEGERSITPEIAQPPDKPLE